MAYQFFVIFWLIFLIGLAIKQIQALWLVNKTFNICISYIY